MASSCSSSGEIVYTEDELVALSALQHFVFCKRQCALIHVERSWVENRLTAEGRLLHETVDSGLRESRGDLRIARGLPLRSLRLGVAGIADCVELRRLPDLGTGQSDLGRELDPGDEPTARPPSAAVRLADAEGLWQPYPVEYKRGRPKRDRCDQVQLCAQALCLEEMLGVSIPEGALYYGQTRRREEVVFDDPLRQQTAAAAKGVHTLLAAGRTPPARRERKCESCSMLSVCLPGAGRASVRSYLDAALKPAEVEPADEDSA